MINYDFKPSEKQEITDGDYTYESNIATQFEFGSGLSYTSFRYSNLTVNNNELRPEGTIKVSVDVENTGSRKGKETVLLFTSDIYASVSPDNKRLRRFKKIEIEPTETKTVEFEINAKDLAFIDMNNQLVAEEGEFILSIAELRETIVLKKTIRFGEKSKIKL